MIFANDKAAMNKFIIFFLEETEYFNTYPDEIA